MTFFLLTLGTRGDFQTVALLGGALRRRGHRVLLGTSSFHAAAAAAAGLEWEPIGGGSLGELLAVLRGLSGEPDRVRRTHLYYRRWLQPQLAAANARMGELATLSDCFVTNLRLTARRAGRLVRGACITYDPPHSVEAMIRHRARIADPAGAILELVALNRALVDPGGLWPADFHFTGFWRDDSPPLAVPPELARWLDAGPPPVVLTMGSMVTFDPVRLALAFDAALATVGHRGLIIGSWSGLAGAGLPLRSSIVVTEAPYEWLFPRSACIVHHGGCGTVSAALRAGRPSILLPQITSQEHFGAILGREGLAVAVLDTAQLDPGQLARAISLAGRPSAELTSRLDRWRGLLAADGGVDLAAELLERHAENG